MRRLRLVLSFLLAALIAPSAAAAAVTLGPTEPNPNPTGASSAPYGSGRLLFNAGAPSGTVLAAPGEGVVTSWRLYTDEVGPGATAQLYALTPVGGGSYRVDAIGPKEALPQVEPEGAEAQNVLNSFTGNLAIPAGAILGVLLEYPSGSTIHPVYYFSATWTMGCLGGGCPAVPAIGGSATASSYAVQLAMNVTFEPTAPNQLASCIGACSAPATAVAPSPVAKKKKKKCKKGKRRKHGKCVKKHKKKRHKRAHGK